MEEAITHLDRRSRFDDLRELMLGWCLWLLGSWGVTLWLDAAQPSVRWMMFSAMTGLMAVWPTVRLSQAQVGFGRPAAGVALSDWVGLAVILQAVIWPLRLIAQAPWWQAIWLDVAILSWSLATGAIIAAGRAFPGALARSGALVLALLLVFGEPLLMLLTRGVITGPMRVSPIEILYRLTGPIDYLDLPGIRRQILAVAVSAVAAWVVILVWAAAHRLAGGRRARPAADG